MKVQLRIGSSSYYLPIADAAKVMELLGGGIQVDSYYVDGVDGIRETDYPDRLEITQVRTAAPITAEQYKRMRDAAAKRDTEKELSE